MAIDMSNNEFIYTSTYMIPPEVMGLDSSCYQILVPGDAPAYPTSAGTSTNSAGIGVRPMFIGYFPESQDYPTTPDTILMPGASAIYTVVTEEAYGLKSGEWFSLEMIPQIGASTLVTKRIDAGLKDGRPLL
jgi:hypothetical protein